jgi:hypothetical protein
VALIEKPPENQFLIKKLKNKLYYNEKLNLIIILCEKMEQPNIYACVGDTRISFGKWYSPTGKTPQECTYCEWCLENGCISMDDVYEIGDVTGCNCDCVNKANHEHIKEYVCTACKAKGGMIMMCQIGTCSTCTHYTSNIGMKHCKGCSAIFSRCKYCGNK